MKSLFLDTSTNLLYIGISDRSKLIKEYTKVGKKDHGKYLVHLIGEELKSVGLTIDDISKIYIGSGPGSYTGLRVSGIVAKMFSAFKEIPLYEVSSLFFLSSGYENTKAVMIDARNDNVFSAIYDNDKTVVKEALRNIEDFKKDAKTYNAKNILLDENNYKVDINEIIKKAKLVSDVDSFSPNYLRETQAERNL